MEERHANPERVVPMLEHRGGKRRELRENEGLLVVRDDRSEDRIEPLKLSASVFASGIQQGRAVAEKVRGMPEDLLHFHDRGAHDRAAPAVAGEGVRNFRELLELFRHVLDERLVEPGLLLGDIDELALLPLVGKIRNDASIRLDAPQDEGARHKAQALLHGLVALVDRLDEPLPKRGLARQQPRRCDREDRVEIREVVLDGRARESKPPPLGQGLDGLRDTGVVILDVLRLVEDHTVERRGGEIIEIACDERIGREGEVGSASALAERLAVESIGAVVNVDVEAGEPALSLALPATEDGHGAHEKRGPDLGELLAFAREEREDLHRFAEAHVVGEDPAEAARVEEREPIEAALLIGAERRLERARCGQRRHGDFIGTEKEFVAIGARGLDAQIQIAQVLVREQASELNVGEFLVPVIAWLHRGGAAGAREEGRRGTKRRGIEAHPLPADVHEFALLFEEFLELFGAQHRFPDGDRELKRRHGTRESHRLCGAILGILLRRCYLRDHAHGLLRPFARKHDRDALGFEHGRIVGEEAREFLRGEVPREPARLGVDRRKRRRKTAHVGGVFERPHTREVTRVDELPEQVHAARRFREAHLDLPAGGIGVHTQSDGCRAGVVPLLLRLAHAHRETRPRLAQEDAGERRLGEIVESFSHAAIVDRVEREKRVAVVESIEERRAHGVEPREFLGARELSRPFVFRAQAREGHARVGIDEVFERGMSGGGAHRETGGEAPSHAARVVRAFRTGNDVAPLDDAACVRIEVENGERLGGEKDSLSEVEWAPGLGEFTDEAVDALLARISRRCRRACEVSDACAQRGCEFGKVRAFEREGAHAGAAAKELDLDHVTHGPREPRPDRSEWRGSSALGRKRRECRFESVERMRAALGVGHVGPQAHAERGISVEVERARVEGSLAGRVRGSSGAQRPSATVAVAFIHASRVSFESLAHSRLPPSTKCGSNGTSSTARV